MFNINIYSKYKVIRQINSCYASYDSDADDWLKKDQYVDEDVLDGGEIIDILVRVLKLKDNDFSEFIINTQVENKLRIDINFFDPSSGESTEYTYFIEEIKDEVGEE